MGWGGSMGMGQMETKIKRKEREKIGHVCFFLFFFPRKMHTEYIHPHGLLDLICFLHSNMQKVISKKPPGLSRLFPIQQV